MRPLPPSPDIWDTFTAIPGTIHKGHTGDVASGHYDRVPEDVALMAELGLDAYRFSISWPRIQPKGTGPANPDGLAFYSDLVDRLLAAGIKPVVTLYHWDLPQALEDAGGWTNRETAHAFAEYARLVAAHLGDRVHLWTTLNEPWCSAYLGYASGEHAPGVQDPASAVRAVHHLNLAHGVAVRAIHEVLGSSTPVSITLNLQLNRAATQDPDDLAAKRRADVMANEVFLGPMLEGRYPQDLHDAGPAGMDWSVIRDGDLELIRAPLAALGVNYYTPGLLRQGEKPRVNQRLTAELARDVERLAPEGPLTEMGWPIDASALTELLVELHERYPSLPLMITENGAAFADSVDLDGMVHDPQRVSYLRDHVLAVADAMDRGADVRAYFAWSLMDNFEWAHGYSKRFGIVYVDYESFTRTVKDSGRWWAALSRSGELPPAPLEGTD